MTEDEYKTWLALAKAILDVLEVFPAHALLTAAKTDPSLENQRIARRMWSAHLEGGPL